MSFSSIDFLGFPPVGFSLRWFQSLITSPTWEASTFTSIRVGVEAAVLATVIGTLAALGLMRIGRHLRPTIAAFILSPMVIPKIIIGIAAFYIFAPLRLIGPGQVGLVLTHASLGIPFVTISVLASLQGIDPRWEQAALTLGANPLRAFIRVVFPLIRPGILTGMFFAFITSFQDLLVALFLTSGSFSNLPKAMWEDLELTANPSLAAVSTVMVVITGLILIAVATVRQMRNSELVSG